MTPDFEPDRLPDVLAIFPLSGVVLLPRGHLPLHVFEPRYLNLTEAALGSGRLIGMIQPRAHAADPIGDDALLYDTGCVGRIVTFSESEDGRFLITLRGICRFRIAEELDLKDGYRRIRPDFGPFRKDLLPETEEGAAVDREQLLATVHQYLDAKDMGADWSGVEKASDEALVTALAMACPFEPNEKQALLESTDLASRAQLLIALLEMAVRDVEAPSAGVTH